MFACVRRSRIKRSHFSYKIGDTLGCIYEIEGTLGKGSYGEVVCCKDQLSSAGRRVAIKIIRNDDYSMTVAKNEIRVLQYIRNFNDEGQELCVRALNWFNYSSHICLTFDLLGLSVFDFLKNNNYHPFSLLQVKQISFQLLLAVKYLHRSGITHCDLKLDNIVFVCSDYDLMYDPGKKQEVRVIRNTTIRLIDFGLATINGERHHGTIATRYYRAPEVILELGWSHPCDIWSIGCIIFELYCGYVLFQAHDDLVHLAMMEYILGQLPRRMCTETKINCFQKGDLQWADSDENPVRNHCNKMKDCMTSQDCEHKLLFDLMKQLLVYEPLKRISARKALQHQFFKNIV